MKKRTFSVIICLAYILISNGCKANKTENDAAGMETITQTKRNWKDEYTKAIRRLKSCENLPDSNICKSTVYYQLGFLFENAHDTLNLGLIDSAEHYYKANLRLFPKDRTTRDRLVVLYQRQNRSGEAQLLLRTLYEDFPAYRAKYALQISKSFYQQQDYSEAFQWSKRCTELDPYLEAGWKNLVMVLDETSLDFREVEELSYKALNYGFINQSLQMIEWYINSNYNEKKIKTSLVHWCNILFDSQSNYETRLVRLPDYEEWPNWGIKQLRTLFELNKEEQITLEDLQQLGFWYNRDKMESPNGVIFSYEILLKFLDQSAKVLMNSDRAISVNRYETGIRMIEDLGIQSYEFTGTYFDFVSALADIFLTYPQLDPDNRKIDRLTSRLFSGKGLAYRDDNREIIKQFHITLGMIYAQCNKWAGGRATNARFQLEHALRNMEKDEYMPLVHEMLGNGYLHFLNNKEGAMSRYLSAAQDYLNLDALFNAKKALDTLNKYQRHMKPAVIDKMKELIKVYEVRNQGRDIKNRIGENGYLEFVENQVSRIRAVRLNESFKNIQIFKIYAELGQQLHENEQLHCYKKALDIAYTLEHVPSYNDLLKIERISHAMQNQIETSLLSFTQLSKNVTSRAHGLPEGERKKITYNAVDKNQIALYIDPGIFEISEVISYFNQEKNQGIKPEISYFNQQVIVRDPNVNNTLFEEFQKEWKAEKKINNLKIRKAY